MRQLALAGLACLALAGCTRTLAPQDFESSLEPPWRGPTAEPVFVYTPPEGSMGWESRRLSTSTVRWNNQDYAEEIAQRIRVELEDVGVPVDENASRVLRIEGVRVTIFAAMRSHCVIDLNRALGSGKLRGYQSRGSGRKLEHACRDALDNVVMDTLADPEVARYLRGE